MIALAVYYFSFKILSHSCSYFLIITVLMSFSGIFKCDFQSCRDFFCQTIYGKKKAHFDHVEAFSDCRTYTRSGCLSGLLTEAVQRVSYI